MPEHIVNYYEPFVVGGGSMMLHVNEHYNIQHSFIADANREVINCWHALQRQPAKLVSHLARLDTPTKDQCGFGEAVALFNAPSTPQWPGQWAALLIYCQVWKLVSAAQVVKQGQGQQPW
jgi:site-specific DNA-adenine methylase